MKNKIHSQKFLILIGITIAISISVISCKKQDEWLNVKRVNNSVVPTTLQDLQAVLDNTSTMNTGYPVISLLGTDNSYITDAVLNGATLVERNSYIWAPDIYQGQTAFDWKNAYQTVEYANIVLDALANINAATVDQTSYNSIKGAALFYRSIAFYYLAQLYCKPYNAASATTDLGIPVRLSSDANIKSVRATTQATYDQITNDLKTAISLLPVNPLYTTRPSQVSANALLSKVYLTMEDYTNAGSYANTSLSLNNTLLDYNSSLVSPTSTYHFPSFTPGNPEVIFFAEGAGYATLYPNGTGLADTNLYRSYATNDLRKTLYYTVKNNNAYLFGSYTGGDGYNFSGIAKDEVYLIRAECYARSGNTTAAMADLNTLLIKRWKTGTYIPYTAVSSTDALRQILAERRKELPFSGLIRWEDLRRLNKDPQFAITVTHKYNGTVYTLLPNDKRYVYPIPDVEIQLNGLTQNDR